LEPLIFESEKNDIFMGGGMKLAKKEDFLGMIRWAKLLVA
jgi:hypothetical protein